MKHTTLACFQGFQCMAGSCPDSCCRAGWEIVIDPRTMDRVKLLPGPDAARVRSAVVDGEEPIWQNRDGVCTLLDPDGLCHLQRHYGPEALCRVCRDYPRFRRFYGARTEHGLSLSCPEALRLLLRPGADLSPVSWEDNAPIEPNDLDAETWLLLQEGRAAALAMLRREDLPAEDRFLLVLELAARLDPEQVIRPRRALSRLRSPIGQRAVRLRAPRFQDMTRYRHLADWVEAYLELEILSDAWRARLLRLQDFVRRAPEEDHYRAERYEFCRIRPQEIYVRYFYGQLWKFWMDACAEGHLLAVVKRALAGTLLLRELHLMEYIQKTGADPLQPMYQLSRETEHSEQNLSALLDRMDGSVCFSRKAFISMIRL